MTHIHSFIWRYARFLDSKSEFMPLTSMSSHSICQFDFWVKLSHLLDDFACLQSELVCGRNTQTLNKKTKIGHQIINMNNRTLSNQINQTFKKVMQCYESFSSKSKSYLIWCEKGTLVFTLTWVHLKAGSTWLSMASTKAAVLPVPDWDWAIRFWGLEHIQSNVKHRPIHTSIL